MRARRAAAMGALLALPALGATVGPGGVTLAPVAISRFRFAPDTVRVAAGDTVAWRNDDIVPHTATADDASWTSGELATGARWSLVARSRGRWSYHCALHPGMKGVLIVR